MPFPTTRPWRSRTLASSASGEKLQATLSVHARRLAVLLATLTALVLTGCAAVTTTSAPTGVRVQNRVWDFTPAAQLLAPPTTSQSSCSRPGFTASTAGLASGFCVATEDDDGPYADNDDDSPTSEPMKPRGSGSSNTYENQQAKYAADEADLTPAQRQTFHRLITGQNLSPGELQEIANGVKAGDY